MATKEKATPSASARSKASGSARERAGATVAPTARPAAAAPRSKVASLRFHAGWREELEGEIVPGGKLRVDYAPDRLPDYRGTHRNKPTWDIVATLLFSPGGQLQSGSVAKKALEVAVPGDAREVTLWFQNTDGSGSAAWDSRYGENYRFGVAGGAVTPASASRAAGRATPKAKAAPAAPAGVSASRARGTGAASSAPSPRSAASGGAGAKRATGAGTNGSAQRGSASRTRGS